VLASAGLIVSAFWFLVARGSIRWLGLWRDEVRRLDRIVNRFQTFDHIESHVSANPLSSPSWVTQWLPAFFLLGWIFLIILLALGTITVA
jgi:hypothetical protein